RLLLSSEVAELHLGEQDDRPEVTAVPVVPRRGGATRPSVFFPGARARRAGPFATFTSGDGATDRRAGRRRRLGFSRGSSRSFQPDASPILRAGTLQNSLTRRRAFNSFSGTSLPKTGRGGGRECACA